MNADEALELARKAYPNDEDLRVAYMLGLGDGYELHEERMMEEAVEAYVNTYRDLAARKSWAEFVVEMPTNNLGDRARIIIVKE